LAIQYDNLGTMVSTVSNILATVFFGLAFLWFIVAVSYAASVVLFLRMRRAGSFQNVRLNDPEFGRCYFCGDRFYLPMGWIFRRFILQYQTEQERKRHKGRIMSKAERRQAMSTLLLKDKPKPRQPDPSETSSSSGESESEEENHASHVFVTTADVEACSEDGENVCSICLGDYASESAAWTSPECVHQFHRGCLLDWLEQPGKAECPCCRTSLVKEDHVWALVKQMRRTRQRSSAKNGSKSPSKKKLHKHSAMETEEDVEAPSDAPSESASDDSKAAP
jgi:hypothetical protein